MRELVLVSGGFDPIHSGHIYLIKDASKHGEVIVLLNSDQWLKEKKGKVKHHYLNNKSLLRPSVFDLKPKETYILKYLNHQRLLSESVVFSSHRSLEY